MAVCDQFVPSLWMQILTIISRQRSSRRVVAKSITNRGRNWFWDASQKLRYSLSLLVLFSVAPDVQFCATFTYLLSTIFVCGIKMGIIIDSVWIVCYLYCSNLYNPSRIWLENLHLADYIRQLGVSLTIFRSNLTTACKGVPFSWWTRFFQMQCFIGSWENPTFCFNMDRNSRRPIG